MCQKERNEIKKLRVSCRKILCHNNSLNYSVRVAGIKVWCFIIVTLKSMQNNLGLWKCSCTQRWQLRERELSTLYFFTLRYQQRIHYFYFFFPSGHSLRSTCFDVMHSHLHFNNNVGGGETNGTSVMQKSIHDGRLNGEGQIANK